MGLIIYCLFTRKMQDFYPVLPVFPGIPILPRSESGFYFSVSTDYK
jgi:hypothetical protein